MGTPVADAFGIGVREVVTLVGGGGKTTTLFRLARELQQRDGCALITTTTHIFVPPPQPDLETIVEAEPTAAVATCLRVLGEGRLPVLGTALTSDGKLAGVAPEVVDACSARSGIHHVVVEADGAAHKPFKAPLDYEPVVPASTTLLVAIVGVDALGKPLDAEHVHRPQRVAELTGAILGEPVTAETIASVLLHPAGPLRDAPRGARSLILLNKADTPERYADARSIAAVIAFRNGPRTLIGALGAEDPFATGSYVAKSDTGRPASCCT